MNDDACLMWESRFSKGQVKYRFILLDGQAKENKGD